MSSDLVGRRMRGGWRGGCWCAGRSGCMMVVGCAKMPRLKMDVSLTPRRFETIDTHESCPDSSSTRALCANSLSTHPPRAHSVPPRASTASHSWRPPKAETSVPPRRLSVSRTLLQVHRMPGWVAVPAVVLAGGSVLRGWCVSAGEGRMLVW